MNGAFRTGLGIAGLAAALAFGGPAQAQDKPLEKFIVGLAVDSMVQQIPMYAARELGYFAEEGLDVQFEVFDGSSAVVQQVVAGNADVGSPSTGALFNAVVQGHELRQIFSFQFKSVFTLATPTNSGVKSVADLKGKAVGVSELSGGEVPIVRAVLREAGLVEGQDTEIIPVGAGAALTMNALQTSQVHAYSSNMFDIAAIEAAGLDLDIIMPKSVENFPGNGIVTRADTLENKRQQLIGFLRGLSKGLLYAEANRDEAYAMGAHLSPEEFEDEKLANASFDAARLLKERPAELADAPIGTHYLPGIQAYHDFLREGSEEEGALKQDIDLTKLLDSSLLEEVNKFDQEAARTAKWKK
jgi:NitT/TauT family transport system substrate-binding protein